MARPSDHHGISDCVNSADYIHDIQKWKNYSLVWKNHTFFYYDFVCQKIRYDWTKEQCESMEARLVLVLSVFGFFGALMSVLTFCRRPFVATDVYLYRTVGLVECVHMAGMTFMHAASFYDCHSSYFCTFFSAHIYMTVTNLCAEAVEFIVVFLCIERTVACMMPQHFHRIHRIGAYRAAALLALLTSLPLNLIHSFDVEIEEEFEKEEMAGNSKIHKYSETSSWFASTAFYAHMLDAQLVRFCLVAPLIVGATAGSIIGLWQAVGRKRRLRGELARKTSARKASSGSILGELSTRKASSVSQQMQKQLLQVTTPSDQSELKKVCVRNYSTTNQCAANDASSSTRSASVTASADRTRKEIKQMIDLCCLQLCLAVPIVINYLLCMAERAAKWNIVIPDRLKIYEEAFKMDDYEDACVMIKRATVLEYLRFAISLTHMMAHGLHFYLYISFSAKFRQTLVDWMNGFKKFHTLSAAIRKRLLFFHRAGGRSASSGGSDGVVENDYEPVPTTSSTGASRLLGAGSASQL